MSFSPDGKTLATASADKVVKLWRLDGILPSFEGNSLSISPDSKIIGIGNQQGVITLRQKDGDLIRSFKADEKQVVKVHFSPDGKVIVSIGKDDQIKLWNLQGKLLKSWQGHEGNNSSSVFQPIRDISFSPDGKSLVSIGEIDKQVKLWDLSGNLLHNWQVDNQIMTSINFSPDGKTVVAAVDKAVKIWNLDGKLLSTLSGHTENIASVSLSLDRKMIATAGNDKTVKLWDMSGKLLINIPHRDNVYSVGFSPDSQILISSSGGNINFWGLDGKLINSLQAGENPMKDISFSPDGKMFTSVDMKNNIILWSLDIDNLQQLSCNWLRDYLANNSNLNEDERRICENVSR